MRTSRTVRLPSSASRAAIFDGCRLRVTYRGEMPVSWSPEWKQDDGTWKRLSETRLLFAPFWRSKRVAFLQNHVLGAT